jgi:hypothetical protein
MTSNEETRRAGLAHQIRQKGRGHREPVALYRDGYDSPAAVGVVQAIETEGVRIAGSFVPWGGLHRVERWQEPTPAERLEYLRGELRAERISYGELAELQGLAEHIDPADVELREAAGFPEHAEETLLDRVHALNRKVYAIPLTGAETVALRGMIADAELSNPARVSVAEKVANVNAEHFKDREEAYR